MRKNNHYNRNYNRRRVVMIERLVLITIFITALLFGIIFVSSKTYARNAKSDSVKMYKSVMVYSGDTIESIASNNYSDECGSFNRYISEIESINNLRHDSKLLPGNHIIIPYYECTNSYDFVISMN